MTMAVISSQPSASDVPKERELFFFVFEVSVMVK